MKNLLFLVLLAPAIAIPMHAQSFHVVYSFGNMPDGDQPLAGLVQDASGFFYGTTSYGGAFGWGTVFKVSLSGEYQHLYDFAGMPDGRLPSARLISDSAGNLYGTTALGGIYNGGTVFRIDSNGTETVLYSFTNRSDGEFPLGDLIEDSQGNLYGTASIGGHRCGVGAGGCGTIFRLDSVGRLSVLYQFVGTTDGAFPSSGLVRDAQGNFYGTASGGGVTGGVCGTRGCGTVFKLSGRRLTTLFTFQGGADGAFPFPGLIQDEKGNLYGVTEAGGTNGGGTVFQITLAGSETVLHTFCMCDSDGRDPSSSLVRDKKGNLFGVTNFGGLYDFGTVFEIDSNGAETVLYNFSHGLNGAYPVGLSLTSTGSLVGTTYSGGASQLGTVFATKP